MVSSAVYAHGLRGSRHESGDKIANAWQAAERYEWKDPYRLICCGGFGEPLRFRRLQTPTPSAG